MARSDSGLIALAAVLAGAVGLGAMATNAAATVPGHPGEPQPPKVAYSEDFENEVQRTPVLLTKYVGAPPLKATYTAAQRFLENCNGYIIEFESNERKTTDCEEVAFHRVRQMAWVLGKLRGATPTSNHAVAAYTDGGKVLPANSVQFETVNAIPLVTNNRFITFSVDAAETNCGHSHAEFKFYLLNGAEEIPTFTSPIDPCSDKNAEVIEPPELGTKPAEPFKAGSFAANAATLFSGPAVGIRMRNGQTSENGNDAAFDNVEILDATPQFDKSFSPTVLSVGETSQLTYTITNTSELAEKNGWAFTDTLPAGLVVATPARASTTCSEPTTVTAVAGGEEITVHGRLAAEINYCAVTVDVTSATAGTYANGPDDVSSHTGVELPGEASVTFGANADLAIEKSASPIPGVPGSDTTYTLKVTNKGPNTAQNTVVSDPLPAGLSFVSGSPECSPTPTEVRCLLGSLASGASVTLTIVAHIADTDTEGFVNTATVSSTTPDPDLSNNSSSAATPIPPQADLEIKKVASLTQVTAGGQVSYALAVNNNGPHDATDVTVTDPLPTGLTIVSAQPSQGTCSVSDGVVCSLGSTASGAGAQILLTAGVAASAGGSIANTATVTGDQTDPNPDNNSSTATIDVTPLTPQPLDPVPTPLKPLSAPDQPTSDLEIVKHVDRATASAGQQLRYTLVVVNHGLDDATDVRVTDSWSLAMEVVSAHASQGRCQAGRPLECALGTVNRNASATITVVAVVRHTGKERNTARVTSANRDPDLGNNQSTAETSVVRRHAKAPPRPIVTG